MNCKLLELRGTGAGETNDEVEKIQNIICDHLEGRPRSALVAIWERIAQPFIFNQRMLSARVEFLRNNTLLPVI